MAVGNTFGATALSSYGGFWISFGIILTPGGFDIQAELASASPTAFYDEFGLYLIVRTLSAQHYPGVQFLTNSSLQGWFIFTTLLVLCTLKSTVAFFCLFFSLDMAFMLLGIGYLHRDSMGAPNPPIIKAGGFFALLAAFMAWYNALAGIADDSNRYVLSIATGDYVARIRLTFFQLLHYPGRPLPLVRQGDATTRQARRCRQQDCIDCVIFLPSGEHRDTRGSELIITMIPLTVLRVLIGY